MDFNKQNEIFLGGLKTNLILQNDHIALVLIYMKFVIVPSTL